MKSKYSLLALAIVSLGFHATAQAETPEYRFVGVSKTTFQGNAGFAAMHADCQTTFRDRKARMCTSEEVFKTPNLLGLNLETASWVQPIAAGGGYNSGVGSSLIVDEYHATLSFSTTQSCNSWTNTQFVGLTYAPTSGSFTNSPCVNMHPVACCSTRKPRMR